MLDYEILQMRAFSSLYTLAFFLVIKYKQIDSLGTAVADPERLPWFPFIYATLQFKTNIIIPLLCSVFPIIHSMRTCTQGLYLCTQTLRTVPQVI